MDPRWKLHFGPYQTPKFRYGKKIICEVRGEVTIVGLSDGRIPWPIGAIGGNKSLVVVGGLLKAIKRESNQAIRHWWGISGPTVTKWRRILGIVGPTEGETRLRKHYAKTEPWAQRALKKMWEKAQDPVRCRKIAASKIGKKRPPYVIEAMRIAQIGKRATAESRQKMSESHRRRGTRPPAAGRAWEPWEEELLRTRAPREVAEKTGRTITAVFARRYQLDLTKKIKPRH